MLDYTFEKYVRKDKKIAQHFYTAISPYADKDKWLEEKISPVINENTARKNRYFHAIANYIDCVAVKENKEFIDSLGAPSGEGWRAIKRWLKEFEQKAHKRLVNFKHPANLSKKLVWAKYGTVLEGKDLADVSFRYNLCTRWEDPYHLYDKDCVLIKTGEYIIQMDWSEPRYPVIEEIQNLENNWPIIWQVLNLNKLREVNNLFNDFSWWLEEYEIEAPLKSKLTGFYLKKLGIEGEGYDFDLNKGVITVQYYSEGAFKEVSTEWIDTPENLELLQAICF